MSRLKDILAKCKFSFVHVVALVGLVAGVVMVKFRHVPETEVRPPAVRGVAKLSKTEIDRSPAIEKLKEDLAKETGLSKEDLNAELAGAPKVSAEVVTTQEPQTKSEPEPEVKKEIAPEVAEAPPVEKKPELVAKNEIELPSDGEDALTVINSVAALEKPATDPNVAPQNEVPELPKKSPKILEKKPKRIKKTMIAQASLAKPKKTAAKKRRAVAKVVKPRIEDLAEPLIQHELEADRESPALGINISSPLEALVEVALQESQPMELWGISQGDGSLAETEIPLEPRLAVQYGEIVETQFSEIEEGLARIRAEELTLTDAPKAPVSKPEPTLVRAPVKNWSAIAKAKSSTKAPVRVARAVTTQKSADKTIKAEAPRLQQPKILIKDHDDDDEGNDPDEDDPIVVSNPVATSIARSDAVESSEPQLTTQEVSEPTLVQSPPLTTQASVAQVPSLKDFLPGNKNETPAVETKVVATPAPAKLPEVVKPAPHSVAETTERESNGPRSQVKSIHGRLLMDHDLASWLDETKSHIEIYLHQKGSRDDVDRKLCEYQFPDEDFECDVEHLTGDQLLVAYVFSPNAPPRGIQYPNPISSSTKDRIRFRLRKAQVETTDKVQASIAPAQVPLLATLFEGASGDERNPIHIPGAEIRIVGFSEWGTLRSDNEGNFRIPAVPAKSEYVVEVSKPGEGNKPGFYSTQKVIPVFSTPAYSSIHLVSEEKVATIASLTKKAQGKDSSLLMGRITQSDSRTPKANQTLELSQRKGGPVYFSDFGFPDSKLKSTSATGLFGFFNVAPSMRTLVQGVSVMKQIPMLLLFKPGFGNYIEIGPSGLGTFKGKLDDPFQGPVANACIRFANQTTCVAQSDEQGNFSIDEINLPPGTLALEVDAENYPVTVHTVGWHSKERNPVRSLFMVEQELIDESANRVAHVKWDKKKGNLVGGAELEFFPDDKSCVFVELYNVATNSKVVDHGPYPLSSAKQTPKGLCLRKSNAGFTFLNLDEGQYVLRWLDKQGKPLRAHVPFVGEGRLSVIVN